MAKGIAHGRTRNAAERDQRNGRLSMKGYFAVFNREISLDEARVQFPEFEVGELVVIRRGFSNGGRIVSVVEIIDRGLRSNVELRLSNGDVLAAYLVDHIDEVELDQDQTDQRNLLVSGEAFEEGRVAVATESNVGIDPFGAVITGVEAGGVRQDVVGISETPGLTRVFVATVRLADHIAQFYGEVPATVIAPAPPITFEIVSGPTPAEMAESIRQSREDVPATAPADQEMTLASVIRRLLDLGASLEGNAASRLRAGLLADLETMSERFGDEIIVREANLVESMDRPTFVLEARDYSGPDRGPSALVLRRANCGDAYVPGLPTDQEIATEIANDPEGPAHAGERVHVAIFGTDEEVAQVRDLDSGDRFMIDPEMALLDRLAREGFAPGRRVKIRSTGVTRTIKAVYPKDGASGSPAMVTLEGHLANRYGTNLLVALEPREETPTLSPQTAQALVDRAEFHTPISLSDQESEEVIGSMVEGERFHVRGGCIDRVEGPSWVFYGDDVPGAGDLGLYDAAKILRERGDRKTTLEWYLAHMVAKGRIPRPIRDHGDRIGAGHPDSLGTPPAALNRPTPDEARRVARTMRAGDSVLIESGSLIRDVDEFRIANDDSPGAGGLDFEDAARSLVSRGDRRSLMIWGESRPWDDRPLGLAWGDPVPDSPDLAEIEVEAQREAQEDDSDLLAGDAHPYDVEFGESRDDYISRMNEEEGMDPSAAEYLWTYQVRPNTERRA